MISSKKKFLITGAGGFVGYHLTTYFSNLGHKVLPLSEIKSLNLIMIKLN